MKTRKIAGVDLNASCFLLVPDETNSFTWRLPVHVPGDTQRTINLVKSNIARFHEMKVPVGQRSALWNRLIGAATALGIPVSKDPVVTVSEEELDFILAERAATELVGRMNLEWAKT